MPFQLPSIQRERERLGPWKEEKAITMALIKTRRDVKQGQKQKAASVFSPRMRLSQQPLYVTQSNTHTHTQALAPALHAGW